MSTITNFLKEHMNHTIEQEAYLLGSRADDNIQIIMMTSIAVSLKRIADTMERMDDGPSKGETL